MNETLILAGGCFWCTEAIFQRLNGVKSVVSGYAGGTKPNPTYEEVSTGTTGYAECVQIEYDPEIISKEKILEVFQATLGGPDIGDQYRTEIFPPDTKFYPAENYHQNFYNNNKDYPYCRVIIDPKIKKLLAEFPTDLKSQSKD